MRRHSLLHHTTWLVPLALLALFLFLFTPPLCAAERGVKRAEISDTANRHALVIGMEFDKKKPNLCGFECETG